MMVKYQDATLLNFSIDKNLVTLIEMKLDL